jgi:hypothetical protein
MATSITPSAGSATFGSSGGSMNLGIQVIQASALLAGRAPSLTAANTANPRNGQPISWNSLAAGAASASIGPLSWSQARFTASASSVFGTEGAALIQASFDGATWFAVAAITDAVAPGVALPGASFGSFGGLSVTPVSGGIVLSATADQPPPYLRCLIQNGDGSSAISIVGSIGTGAL